MGIAPRQYYSCPSDDSAGPPEPQCLRHIGWGRALAALGTGIDGSGTAEAETPVNRLTPLSSAPQPTAQERPYLDGVKNELLCAIGTRLGALGALRSGMLGQ